MENVDSAYPSIVQDQNQTIDFLDDSKLCPKHQEEAKLKHKEKKAPTRKKNPLAGLFGKNPIERKLEKHGIKMKVEQPRKNKVQPHSSMESAEDNILSLHELQYLSVKQLEQLVGLFTSQIDVLRKEETEVVEENQRHYEDVDGLKLTVTRLEELTVRVMKPWVNNMPRSDEMTRVMLLN